MWVGALLPRDTQKMRLLEGSISGRHSGNAGTHEVNVQGSKLREINVVTFFSCRLPKEYKRERDKLRGKEQRSGLIECLRRAHLDQLACASRDRALERKQRFELQFLILARNLT
jgi:hypothetical protein